MSSAVEYLYRYGAIQNNTMYVCMYIYPLNTLCRFYSDYLQARCGQSEFYYHMYGDFIGKLEVALLNGSQRSLLFEVEGDQGDQWKKASLRLNDLPPESFRVSFLIVLLLCTNEPNILGNNFILFDSQIKLCAEHSVK